MLRQAHFVEGDALLLGFLQELLHTEVPLGGGGHLFEQVTADEQERGKERLRLQHGGSPCKASSRLDPFASFGRIYIIPRQSRGVIHARDRQERLVPDAGMMGTIVTQHAQRGKPCI